MIKRKKTLKRSTTKQVKKLDLCNIISKNDELSSVTIPNESSSLVIDNTAHHKNLYFARLFNIYPLKPVLVKKLRCSKSLNLQNTITEKKIKGVRIFCVYKQNENALFFNKYCNIIKNITVPLIFNCSISGCVFDGVLSPTNVYHVYDIQYAGFEKVTHKLLLERKKILKNVLTDSENVQVLPYEESSSDIEEIEHEVVIKKLNESYKSNKTLWYAIIKERKTIMNVLQLIKNDKGKYKEVVCFSEAHNRPVTCDVIPRTLSWKLLLGFDKKPKKAIVLHDSDFQHNRLLSFIW